MTALLTPPFSAPCAPRPPNPGGGASPTPAPLTQCRVSFAPGRPALTRILQAGDREPPRGSTRLGFPKPRPRTRVRAPAVLGLPPDAGPRPAAFPGLSRAASARGEPGSRPAPSAPAHQLRSHPPPSAPRPRRPPPREPRRWLGRVFTVCGTPPPTGCPPPTGRARTPRPRPRPTARTPRRAAGRRRRAPPWPRAATHFRQPRPAPEAPSRVARRSASAVATATPRAPPRACVLRLPEPAGLQGRWRREAWGGRSLGGAGWAGPDLGEGGAVRPGALKLAAAGWDRGLGSVASPGP